jgi:hypothetical protein
MLGASIDDLDGLIAELTEVRQRLSLAELRGVPEDALWEAETALRHTADRAVRRADVVRRAIELHRRRPTA